MHRRDRFPSIVLATALVALMLFAAGRSRSPAHRQLLAAGSATTPTIPYPFLEGQIGGLRGAPIIKDEYMYMTIGRRMTALGLGDPYAPELLWRAKLSSDWPNLAGGVVSGDYAYYLHHNYPGSGLTIYDLGDALHPRQLSALELGSVWALAVEGDYAYLIGPGRLAIIDVSDPEHPALLASWEEVSGLEDVQVSGGIAFVAAGETLELVDVSDPAQPVGVGSYVGSGSVDQVLATSGNLVYLSEDWSRLRALDVSDPTAPVPLDDYAFPIALEDVVLQGSLAYVLGYYGALYVLDVSNPEQLTLVSQLDLPDVGTERTLILHEDVAYVADGYPGTGIWAIDISDPANLSGSLVYADNLPRRVATVAANDHYAFVDSSLDGMHFVDYTVPDSVDDAGYLGAYHAWDVKLVDDTAYLLTPYDLRILDVTSPSQPAQIGHYEGETGSYLAVEGTHVYLATSSAEQRQIQVVDVADPANPTLVGQGPLLESGRYSELEGADGIIYAGVRLDDAYDWWGWLELLDVSEPAEPAVISTVGDGWVDGVAIHNSRVAVGWTECTIDETGDPPPWDLEWRCADDVSLYDVSDPAQPALLFEERLGVYITVGGPTYDDNLPFFVGDYLLFAGGPMLDLSDPANIQAVGTTPANAVGSAQQANKLFTDCDGLCTYSIVEFGNWAYQPVSYRP